MIFFIEFYEVAIMTKVSSEKMLFCSDYLDKNFPTLVIATDVELLYWTNLDENAMMCIVWEKGSTLLIILSSLSSSNR